MTYAEIKQIIEQSVFLEAEKKASLLAMYPNMSAKLQAKTQDLARELQKQQEVVIGKFLMANPEFLVEAKQFAQNLRKEDLFEREEEDHQQDKKILLDIESELEDIFNEVQS